MSIVWPCSLSVDEYAQAGPLVEVPAAVCPDCHEEMGSWSGYVRFVREGGVCQSIWICRARCKPCRKTHALLPSFLLIKRLDVVTTIGRVIEESVGGSAGVRPAAQRVAVPFTTARGWVRRFRTHAEEFAVGFGALAVELGGAVVATTGDLGSWSLRATAAAWQAAMALPGWLGIGRWGFCSSAAGGRLIAITTNSPYLVVGKRRFMAPVP